MLFSKFLNCCCFSIMYQIFIIQVERWRLILANISGQGGRGGGLSVATSPLQILTIACLTFCLFLTYSPILGLPEYTVKVFNIGEMHGTGGREVVVFDRFQWYVEIVRKSKKKCYNSFIFQFNYLKSTCYM